VRPARSDGRPAAHSATVLVGLIAAALAGLPAQTNPKPPAAKPPTAPAARVVAFTAPDGSRFVLAPDASVPHVHWAIATFADAGDEPDGLEGLGMAVLHASLGGTWRTGSRDAERERQALNALDQAWHELLAAPQQPAAMVDLRRREAAVAELADPVAWRRVLATLPVDHPEIADENPVGTLTLTTLADTLGEVAVHLVERREEQALRELPSIWMRELLRRQQLHDSDPAVRVHAEVLALAMPGQAAGRAAERPGRAMPTREQALGVWARTQRPERTVHVLCGDFEVEAAQTALATAFARTGLPAAPPPDRTPVRPIASQRRSTIPGTSEPIVALAWQLPPGVDPFVLDTTALWFGHPETGWLVRELRRGGLAKARTTCRAPWPVVVGGQSLLLLEIRGCDPAGLADRVLKACSKAVEKEPPAGELATVATDLQLLWTTATNNPRGLARDLARRALLWPEATPTTTVPERVPARAVQALLTAVFAGNPVIVEGRP
jgi:hypothetical protein